MNRRALEWGSLIFTTHESLPILTLEKSGLWQVSHMADFFT